MQYKKWETFRKLINDSYYKYYISMGEDFSPTDWQLFIDITWTQRLISWIELKELHKVKNVPQRFTDDLWDALEKKQKKLNEVWKLYWMQPNAKKWNELM